MVPPSMHFIRQPDNGQSSLAKVVAAPGALQRAFSARFLNFATFADNLCTCPLPHYFDFARNFVPGPLPGPLVVVRS